MSDYESLNHSTWECKYHIVWIPKYRRKKLYKSIREDLGREIRQLGQLREGLRRREAPDWKTVHEGHRRDQLPPQAS